MQYEPIKRSLGRFFTGPLFMRKILYSFMDLLLLRTWHVKRALKKIRPLLPSDAAVLDAGSGFGQYTWRISRMNRGYNIKGVDIDPEHVADCAGFFKRAGLADRVVFQTDDLTNLNDKNTYDLILSVDVMEHIKDDARVFYNFFDSLKDNGILLISTPSDQGGSDVHNEGEESFIDEHVRNGYSIAEITEKLNRAGFSSAEAAYTYGKPGSISWRLSMKYPVKMLNISYIFFLILPFYYLVIYPVSAVLNFMDLCQTHDRGTGLLVIARK